MISMEKLIFRKFFNDTLGFFLLGTLTLSLIVWVIQAVNYLDFVSEDGHSFKVYFYYTLLNFPKIFSRLVIFMFFISIFYTIIKYDDKNELIIFWTNGIRKREFFNFIINFSLIFVILQLILNIFIVPNTQDKARSYIRSSNIDYFPSLIKSKKFVSVVEDLTLFIERKDKNGGLYNIFLKETKGNSTSQIISAREGMLKKDKDNFYLVLYDGNIIDSKNDNSNIISYKKTTINLSSYSTKTTVDPKIQEQSTKLLIKCVVSIFKYGKSFKEKNLDCNKKKVSIVIEELYKRLLIPFYIFIVAIIGSCLIFTTNKLKNNLLFKYLIFIFGIVFIAISQVISQYANEISLNSLMISLLPFLTLLLFYIFIQFRMKE